VARLSARALNRTLLLRQHLLARTGARPADLVSHLLGLQGQDPLPPYLGLAARLERLEPLDVSAGLEHGDLVRLVTLRGTLHLHTADDAALLRPWVAPMLEAHTRSAATFRPAADLDRTALDAALGEVMASGPVPMAEITAGLATVFAEVPERALAGRVRNSFPLVQLPPRGCWGRSGGIVYERLERWTGRPLVVPGPEQVRGIVERYLRAFGPATAADVTTWSGVTRLGPVLAGLDGLVRHEDERGRMLYDVPDAPLADEDSPAPVRLLGTYDNLWLSHAARDRVMPAEARSVWAGRNGGVAGVIVVDGVVTGLWKPVDGRVEVVRLLRDLDPAEADDLAEETARVEALLAG